MDWMWHRRLPLKVTTCMWKAGFKCITVDDRVQSRGIALASRCDCCVSPRVETLDHVLGSGKFAQNVWRMVTVNFGVVELQGDTWEGRVSHWLSCAKKFTKQGVLLRLLPSVIT